MTKIRVRFTEHGKVRFLSHRDVARIMERAFRRLRLPIAYSQGFSPRPKVSFGLALSVAYESDAEYLDIELVTPIDLQDIPSRLSEILPNGFSVTAVEPLEAGSISLQQAIVCCNWRIEVLGASLSDVTAAVSELLQADELPLERSRKGKVSIVDVRPAILDLEVTGPTDVGVQLLTTLATSGTSLRPSELVQVLDAKLSEGRVCRTHQFINVDGQTIEPIAVLDPSTAHELQQSSRSAAELELGLIDQQIAERVS